MRGVRSSASFARATGHTHLKGDYELTDEQVEQIESEEREKFEEDGSDGIKNIDDIDDIDELTSQGELLFDQERYEEALEYLSKAIELKDVDDEEEEDEYLYAQRGQIYSEMERYDEALADFDRGVFPYFRLGFYQIEM